MTIPVLFDDDFPTVRTSAELDEVVACYPTYDRYYIASGCIEERRRLFEALWQDFHPYADGHFMRQRKLNWHERSWEMYLGVVFVRHGLALAPPLDHGPDFRIISPVEAWVEAVTTGRGAGRDAVPELLEGVSDYPEDPLLLRLRNSIDVKHKKYADYLRDGLVSKEIPRIVAVNRGALLHPELPVPLMVKAAYGIGHQVIPLAGGESFWAAKANVVKTSGAVVDLPFFRDTAFSALSAVIYSPSAVVSHPTPLGSDCIVVHNPLAELPIADEMFSFLEQWRLDGEEARRILPT